MPVSSPREGRTVGRLDRLAIALSSLCVVHCVATVALAATLATAGTALANPAWHEIGFAAAMAIGAIALGRGFALHRDTRPLAIGITGLGLMAIGADDAPRPRRDRLHGGGRAAAGSGASPQRPPPRACRGRPRRLDRTHECRRDRRTPWPCARPSPRPRADRRRARRDRGARRTVDAVARLGVRSARGLRPPGLGLRRRRIAVACAGQAGGGEQRLPHPRPVRGDQPRAAHRERQRLCRQSASGLHPTIASSWSATDAARPSISTTMPSPARSARPRSAPASPPNAR